MMLLSTIGPSHHHYIRIYSYTEVRQLVGVRSVNDVIRNLLKGMGEARLRFKEIERASLEGCEQHEP